MKLKVDVEVPSWTIFLIFEYVTNAAFDPRIDVYSVTILQYMFYVYECEFGGVLKMPAQALIRSRRNEVEVDVEVPSWTIFLIFE
jgi:hypothetical protein